MTPESQRVAIATYCGWRFIPMRGGLHGYFYLNIKKSDIPIAEKGGLRGATGVYDLPDYVNDLNAMSAAWESLPTVEMRVSFHNWLLIIVRRRCKSSTDIDTWCVMENAHAPERAEAFIRTIGKWLD